MLPANMLILQENQRIIQRNLNVERMLMRNSRNPFEMDDRLFKGLFRLDKECARLVLDQILPFLNNNPRGNVIEPHVKLFTALAFYATGSYQRLIGQSYTSSVCQQSVSNVIREITNVIYQHLRNEYIKFPIRPLDKLRIKQEFHRRYGFPGVCGVIDCTHVRKLAPRVEEHNYVNRKGYHSKNVQIVCNADLIITSINPRYGGATHDSFIWRNSVVHRHLRANYQQGDRSTWLLGDSGYPLQPWMMTPILNVPENTPEGRYTQAHVRARNCMERCNGVLKGRFRCLNNERGLRYSPEIVGKIVIACSVLHNICRQYGVEEDFEVPVEPHEPVHIPEPVGRNDINEGRRVRNGIVRRYF